MIGQQTHTEVSLDYPVRPGDTLSAILVGSPSHGTLTLNSDGSLVYMPSLNFNGTDSFTYKASDGQALSTLATVTITVTPVNDPPVADASPAASFV